ncbi:MAG: lysylphosphatidylglycerol synthase transmembrane domain-containing protein [bacterium]
MKLRVAVGVIISGIFIFLAFRQVDLRDMAVALKSANYWWLLPALIFMFTSHGLRARRWGYFLKPITSVKLHPLFSALMIGYAANNVFPLRLGEFLRAFAIGKSAGLSKSSAFATVIVERLIDVLTLLIILAATILIYPLPDLIKNSGYVIFAFTVAVIVLMVFLMEKTEGTIAVMRSLAVTLPHKLFNGLRALFTAILGKSRFEATLAAPFESVLVTLPSKSFELVQKVVRSFLQGFIVFKKSEDFLSILLVSILIWVLYAGVILLAFYAFDFQDKYNLGLVSSLVVLVTISIGIMIPSSPGFVGTYHFFCMVSLKLYGVPQSEALSFAVISHAVNFIPATLVGLVYFWRENLHFSDAVAERELVEHEAEEQKVPGVIES